MSQWNLLQSISVTMWIQRILCVSPFHLDHTTGALNFTCMNKLYTVSFSLVILIVMFISVFYWDFINDLSEFFPQSGLVWRIFNAYSITTLNFHFILNIIIIWSGVSQQMHFLERIHAIDRKFRDNFTTSVDHKRFKRHLFYGVITLYTFYCSETILAETTVFYKEKTRMAVPLFLFILLNVVLNTQVFALATYIFLIERRYRLLWCVFRRLQREYILYCKSGIYDEMTENEFFTQFANIFEFFKEITNLIEMFNDCFGWIYVSQIPHTFVATLGQMYFVILTFTNNEPDALSTTLGITYLVFGDGIKLLISAVAIHSVYAAVRLNMCTIYK